MCRLADQCGDPGALNNIQCRDSGYQRLGEAARFPRLGGSLQLRSFPEPRTAPSRPSIRTELSIRRQIQPRPGPSSVSGPPDLGTRRSPWTALSRLAPNNWCADCPFPFCNEAENAPGDYAGAALRPDRWNNADQLHDPDAMGSSPKAFFSSVLGAAVSYGCRDDSVPRICQRWNLSLFCVGLTGWRGT